MKYRHCVAFIVSWMNVLVEIKLVSSNNLGCKSSVKNSWTLIKWPRPVGAYFLKILIFFWKGLAYCLASNSNSYQWPIKLIWRLTSLVILNPISKISSNLSFSFTLALSAEIKKRVSKISSDCNISS